MIKAVLFDFGGVIAEEGFREGLLAIGRKFGLGPEAFFAAVDRIIYESGYLTGSAGEADFWKAVRAETGITGSDRELREELLRRFVIRREMIDRVDGIRAGGITAALLSDQTNWLEEIDGATGLYRHFDRVFNSYRIGKSKRDPSVFPEVCAALAAAPGETLFVDDNERHKERAEGMGLRTILFTTVGEFQRQIAGILRGPL
jgi:putative hydrolase of the HAD superfamily